MGKLQLQESDADTEKAKENVNVVDLVLKTHNTFLKLHLVSQFYRINESTHYELAGKDAASDEKNPGFLGVACANGEDRYDVREERIALYNKLLVL